MAEPRAKTVLTNPCGAFIIPPTLLEHLRITGCVGGHSSLSTLLLVGGNLGAFESLVVYGLSAILLFSPNREFVMYVCNPV
jgi:hypothetical protein